MTGLRSWSLPRYPDLVLHVEQPDGVDVWRVSHEERDIPAWMNDADGA